MTRVLIIAGDVLPLPGYPTTGAGLRAWGLGQGLISQGFEVLYSMPEYYVRADSHGPERELCWHPADREKPIRLTKPDVIVACHWPAMPTRRQNVPIVLDLHGPHLMERYFWDRQQARSGVMEKISAFRNADFFICAGERQRYYFFNWLLLAGFPLESRLIRVVPVSLSPELPVRVNDNNAKQDTTFVYGGMFLPWQDPVRPLLTLTRTMTDLDRGSLLLFGGPHPIVKDSSGTFERLMQELDRHDRVRIMPSVPHDELIKRYMQAQVAFDVMEPNPERELAYTTRTVEYLWCGLPVIYTAYGELAGLIGSYDAGWLCAAHETERLRDIIKTVLTDPQACRDKSNNARKLVRECLTWDKTITPLADFCRKPSRSYPFEQVFPVPSSLSETEAVQRRPPWWQRLIKYWSHPTSSCV
ncbi:glycosyltransferase [bacterium]|nr:glycosyltransferase [bacterium]